MLEREIKLARVTQSLSKTGLFVSTIGCFPDGLRGSITKIICSCMGIGPWMLELLHHKPCGRRWNSKRSVAPE